MTVNTLSAPPTATFIREPLSLTLSPAAALARLGSEPMPFALTGLWAGGSAILGSDPLVVAGEDEDPFVLLDRLPPLGGGPPPPGAVGGGWFGWLGYRLGARVERVPAGPPRPVPMPDFHLAYYDHVLRCDEAGQWWFEALATPERRAELEARRRHLKLCSTGAPPARGSRLAPTAFADAAAAHHLAAVAACRAPDRRRRDLSGQPLRATRRPLRGQRRRAAGAGADAVRRPTRRASTRPPARSPASPPSCFSAAPETSSSPRRSRARPPATPIRLSPAPRSRACDSRTRTRPST